MIAFRQWPECRSPNVVHSHTSTNNACLYMNALFLGLTFFLHCAHTSSHVTRVYVIIIRLQQRTTLKVHLPILSFVIARRLQRQTSAFAVVGLARLRDIGTGFWLPLPLSFVLQPQQQHQQWKSTRIMQYAAQTFNSLLYVMKTSNDRFCLHSISLFCCCCTEYLLDRVRLLWNGLFQMNVIAARSYCTKKISRAWRLSVDPAATRPRSNFAARFLLRFFFFLLLLFPRWHFAYRIAFCVSFISLSFLPTHMISNSWPVCFTPHSLDTNFLLLVSPSINLLLAKYIIYGHNFGSMTGFDFWLIVVEKQVPYELWHIRTMDDGRYFGLFFFPHLYYHAVWRDELFRPETRRRFNIIEGNIRSRQTI